MMTFNIKSNVQNASILRCPPKQFDLLPYFTKKNSELLHGMLLFEKPSPHHGHLLFTKMYLPPNTNPIAMILTNHPSHHIHQSSNKCCNLRPIIHMMTMRHSHCIPNQTNLPLKRMTMMSTIMIIEEDDNDTPDVKQAIAMQSPIHHTHDDDATFTLYPKPNESIIEEDDNDEYNNENNELEYFIAYPFNEETNQQFLILNDNKYHYKTNNARKFYWYCRQEGCRGSLRTIRPHAYTTDATKPFGKIYYVREHTFDHEPTWSLQIAQKQATQHVLCWYICDVFLLFFFLCFHCFLFRRQYRIH
eukprot:942914_1